MTELLASSTDCVTWLSCCCSVVVKPVNPAHSSTLISIAPRRPVSRPQYVTFNKQTAALYLRQTESLWLNLDLTRQEGKRKALYIVILLILSLVFSH